MSDSRENLERLISRYLDDEATPGDRRELEATLRRDREADALFEEFRALDREAGVALRKALGRPMQRRRPAPLRVRAARFMTLAVAAGLAAMVTLTPRSRDGASVSGNDQPQMASWFAPFPGWGDTLSETPPSFERPQVGIKDTDRDWIVIPSEREGEFLVIEIKRIHTLAIRLQQDF